jgi:ArsR family transcriptional regulator
VTCPAPTATLPALAASRKGAGTRESRLGTEKKLGRLAGLFHALSDPTRLAVLERLALGERCVCDLTGLLSLGQSRLSFHLRTLKDAGLVTDRREGRWIYYSLAPEAVRDLLDHATSLCCPSKPEGDGCCGT